VFHCGGHKKRFRGEVMQPSAVRQASAPCNLRRAGFAVAKLVQALDRGFEEPLSRFRTALGLSAVRPFPLRHGPLIKRSVSKVKRKLDHRGPIPWCVLARACAELQPPGFRPLPCASKQLSPRCSTLPLPHGGCRVPLCAGALHRSTTVRAALALRRVRAFEAGACSLISEAHVFPRAYGAAVAASCRHRPRARQLPALERGW